MPVLMPPFVDLFLFICFFQKSSSSITFPFNIFQVVTFWEGEIVDTKNYTFFTGKWEATYVLFLSFFSLFIDGKTCLINTRILQILSSTLSMIAFTGCVFGTTNLFSTYDLFVPFLQTR